MGRLPPRALTLVVAACLAAVLAGTAARAQVGNDPLPTLPTTTTTTTTAPPSSTTTTTTAPPPSSTAPPEPRPTTTTTLPSTTPPTLELPPTTLPLGSGDGPPGPGVVPPEAKSLIDSIARSPANDTRRLLAALRPLVDMGLSESEAVQLGFGSFPVGGEANWSHDWWFPRHVPTFHLHEGTDIFAAEGTPVRAPVAGVLEQANGSIGGLSVYIRQPNGGYVYMSHLSAYEPGQVSGQEVKVGDIVGRVGTTGNAQGTSPHVHFELHPAATKVVTTGKGKARTNTVVEVPVPLGTQLPAVDPKAQLDRWVEEAIAAAPAVIAAYESRHPRAVITTGLTRRLADGGSGPFAAPSGPPRSHLMWASSASPAGGVLRLVEAEATAAADELDYDAVVREEQQRIREWEAGDSWARAVLAPLTPKGLQPVLGLAAREPDGARFSP
ncbi:MAG TPA: M23 family metallopeptidase [Acidimicrobiales bacterium]|nr:M23 family metallopeptidase [Acidimicrobiales bacterium]